MPQYLALIYSDMQLNFSAELEAGSYCNFLVIEKGSRLLSTAQRAKM